MKKIVFSLAFALTATVFFAQENDTEPKVKSTTTHKKEVKKKEVSKATQENKISFYQTLIKKNNLDIKLVSTSKTNLVAQKKYNSNKTTTTGN